MLIGKYIFLLCALFIFNMLMVQYVTKIFFLKKEYWWRGATILGTYNLLIQNNNSQTSPILISNMGRYIWSNSPFYAEITEKQIAITSNFEKINIYQAEHTLKEAYEDDLGKITKEEKSQLMSSY